jgi:hypothetical protein
MTVEERQTSLFGGALRCYIPPTFLDISKMRQVPDNQEVFADNNSDSSLIIELLQIPDSETLPAIYHYTDLAESNSASSSSTIISSSSHTGPISYVS